MCKLLRSVIIDNDETVRCRKGHFISNVKKKSNSTIGEPVNGQNRQNTRSFGKFLAGNTTRPPAPVAAGFRLRKLEWK